MRSRGDGSPMMAPVYGSASSALLPSSVIVAGAVRSARRVRPIGAAPGLASVTFASSVSGDRGWASTEAAPTRPGDPPTRASASRR